jgi:hypothetical protein
MEKITSILSGMIPSFPSRDKHTATAAASAVHSLLVCTRCVFSARDQNNEERKIDHIEFC